MLKSFYNALEAAVERATAKDDSAGYLATIKSIEPNIHAIDAGAFYASAAISLKRIADHLEKVPTTDDTQEASEIIGKYLDCTNGSLVGLNIINALAIGGFKIVRK